MPVLILASLELRWFEPGALPASVQRWFDDLPHPIGTQSRPERRTDTYLPTPGAHNVSVKLSRGSLETKVRLEQADFRGVAGRVDGVSERWTKWSWPYAHNSHAAVYDAFASEQRADWLELEKARWQRKYRMVNGSPEAVPSNSRVEVGYAIEVVDGTFRGTRWWSIGIDAFAPEDGMRAMLDAAVGLLETDFPRTLTRAQSMSYPAWLTSLAGG